MDNREMGSPRTRVVLGWVLVSYFMIAGGFALAAVAVTLAGLTGEGPGDAVFFVGSLVGGLFAGRASRHKAVVEPAVAAVLVVATLFGVFAVGLDRRFTWAGDDGALLVALKLGLVAGLGGLVGGLIGRRSQGGAPTQSALRWWGIATLINLGATFLLVALVMLLASRGGDPDDSVAGVLLGLTISWLVSGFVAQVVAPRKMCWVCGAGSIGIVLLGAAFSAAEKGLDSSSVAGAVFLWGLGSLVGALGALLGWKLVASRAEPTSPVELPEVRLRR